MRASDSASLGVASSASAATDATATVTAEILSTLAITVDPADNTLNFGSIADQGVVGSSTVVVSAAGARTCGANLACSGAFNAPTFNIVGLTGSSVAVSLPASSILTYAGVVPTGMDSDLTVSTFTTNLPLNQMTLASGLNPFTVGGTLTVSPLQAPGVYTGAVMVSVQYN